MKRLFVLTPEAKNDLRRFFSISPRIARIQRRGSGPNSTRTFRTLGRSPGVGHYHDEILSRKYRFWNFYSYAVAYVWESRPVQVISIVHGARDLAVFFTLRGAGPPHYCRSA